MSSKSYLHGIMLCIVLMSLCISLRADFSAAISPLKRVESTTNIRTYYQPYNQIVTTTEFRYANHATTLIDSIISTDVSTSGSVTVTRYQLHHRVQNLGELTKVEYFLYIPPSQDLQYYFRFVKNLAGDLVEFRMGTTATQDSIVWLYTYYAPGKPEGMYNKLSGPSGSLISSYKLVYDTDDRLVSGTRYIQGYDYGGNPVWQPYSRCTQLYNADPFHYHTPLNFNNYRMETLLLGGFEDINAVFDKCFAPGSIIFEYWNYGQWTPSSAYSYSVQIIGDHVNLISSRQSDYTGIFSFDRRGLYVQKYVDYEAPTDVSFFVYWYGDEPDNAEQTSLPALMSKSPVPVFLLSTYPNPFLSELTITLQNKLPLPTDISIYNIKGQLIRSWKDVKSDELIWDGKDKSNHPVSSGIYLIRARQGKQISTAKVLKY